VEVDNVYQFVAEKLSTVSLPIVLDEKRSVLVCPPVLRAVKGTGRRLASIAKELTSTACICRDTSEWDRKTLLIPGFDFFEVLVMLEFY
jgi:hypothetical protein